MKHIGENDSQSDFVTVLRMTSGQDSEPDFVLVEHAYALPWNSQSETTLCQPRKTLFLSKLFQETTSGSNEYIDIENISFESTLPYDIEKGRHLMKECERHVVFAKLNQTSLATKEPEDDEDSDCDWIDKVNKNGWTDDQCNLFSSVTKILDGDYLAKLTLQNNVNEPVKQRAVIDKTSGKFNQAMSRFGWDIKLAQWLHNILLQHMSTQYIASYLDILQTLKSKIPTCIDRMISHSFSLKKPNFEALNLLLKRPWDPVSPVFNQFKPLKMENQPIVIHVPSGAGLPNVPLNLRRFRFFNIQLQHLVKYVSISHTSADTVEGGTVLDAIITDVRKKIVEYKGQYPAQPIVLLGWGVGALLACHISLVEKVSANICLGFPMKSFDGMRGGSNDPLLSLNTPTLFIIGQNSTDVSVDSMEDFRTRLQTPTSLVVIAEGGNLMKVSADKCYFDGITQSMVDRCIVDEIGEFLTRVFNDDNNNKEIPAVTSNAASYISSSSSRRVFTNPLPPKTTRKELPRKRKISPSSLTDFGNSQSSKIQRITETRTAISQNLGLKIPVGISSVLPLLKNDKSLPTTSTSSSHVHFSVNSKGVSNMLELPQEASDSAVKRRQTGSIKDMGSTFRISQGGSNSDVIATKPVASSFDGCSLTPGSSSPMATISLGALASVSRQKYQRMIQISDSSDLSLPDKKNIFEWNPKPSGKVDSEIGLVGKSSLVNTSARNRASDSSSEFHIQESDVKQVPQQNSRQVNNQTAAKSAGNESSQILVTSSLLNPSVPPKGRRGRPPLKNKGLTSYRPIKAMLPSTSGAGRPFYSPMANQQSDEGTSKERTSSMAVLTLTGAAGDGTGVEAAGKGISSLGRGVLTLAKGGTSTVRVYSASSQKLSPAVSPSNFSQPLQKIARGSLLFTNITASTAGMNKTSDVTTVCQSSPKSTQIVKRATSAGTTGQISLNLQGISASRSLTAARNVNSLNTANLGVSRPTVMILTNASDEEASSSNVSSTTTTTTISSSGVKTTKSVIGLRMAIPPVRSNFDSLQDYCENQSSESNVSFPIDGSSELDLLASAASELYKKENLNVTFSEPPLDVLNEKNVNSKDNLVTVMPSEASSKAAPSTIKSNITFISAKSINKPSFMNPHLARHSTGLQLSPSYSSQNIPTTKASSIRFIRNVGQQSTMFKTAVGTTSTGKIVTKTFTVNNTNTGMTSGNTNKTFSFGKNSADAEKRSRGTSTDFFVLDSTYQASETPLQGKYIRNRCLDQNLQRKVKKPVAKGTDVISRNVDLSQNNLFLDGESNKALVEDSAKWPMCPVEAAVSIVENSKDHIVNTKSDSILKIQTTTTDKNQFSIPSNVSNKLTNERFRESSPISSGSQATPFSVYSTKKSSINPVIRVTTSSPKITIPSAVPNSPNFAQSYSLTNSTSNTSASLTNPIICSKSETPTLVKFSTKPEMSIGNPNNLGKSPVQLDSNYVHDTPTICTDTVTDSNEKLLPASSSVQDVEKTLVSEELEDPVKKLEVEKGQISSEDVIDIASGNEITGNTLVTIPSPESLESAISPKVSAVHSNPLNPSKELSQTPNKMTPSKSHEENSQSNKSNLRITRSTLKSPAGKRLTRRSNSNSNHSE